MKLLIAILPLLASPAWGQTFTYHPDLALHLGYGVNISNLDDVKGFSPFNLPIRSQDENVQGTPETKLYQYLIESESDLNSSYGIDASAQARYMGVSASASYSIRKEELLNEKSLTIVLGAISNFGKESITMVNSDINDDAKSLISSRNWQLFVSKYGNYYVNQVEHESRINVYLTISDITSKTKESISKSAKAGGSFGSFGGGASVSINSEISRASATKQLTINVQSRGDSTGFAGLYSLISDAITSPDPIKSVQAALKEYSKQFTRANSPISKYYLSSMTSFGLPDSGIHWNKSTELYLQRLLVDYNKMSLLLGTIEDQISNQNLTSLTSSSIRHGLNEERTQVTQLMANLIQSKDDCLSGCNGTKPCCKYVSLVEPELPYTDTVKAVLSQLSFVTAGAKYTPFHDRLNLIHLESPQLLNSFITLSIEMYCIPVNDESVLENMDYGSGSIPTPRIALLVNGDTLARGFTLEPINTIPRVFFNADGSIAKYSAHMEYKIDHHRLWSSPLTYRTRLQWQNCKLCPYEQQTEVQQGREAADRA
jgi:hypothetical protein